MKQLPYGHLNSPPLVVIVYRLIRAVVGRLIDGVARRPALTRRRQLVLAVAGVVLSLLLQSLLLWLLYQAIDLSISLMEVWTELAAKHLEITLDRSS